MIRPIGHSGLKVEAIGLGCMGLSEFYGAPTDKDAAIKLIHEAISLGVNHFDTAEMYGMGANETLVGAALKGKRDKVVLATKFGPMRDPETGRPVGIDGSPANCRRAIEGSLKRLGTDYVDLYYLHRVSPTTPIEETVEAMAELVKEGKVRAIGLSEAASDTIRRAADVHPIAAVQSEYSIFSRDIEDTVLKACADVGASLVAYSPLGRGMLTGAFTNDKRPGDKDYRSLMNPRFQKGAYEANLALVQEIEAVAKAKGATPAQVALAWVIGRGDNILTIPGTTKLSHLKTNLGAYDVALTDGETARLDALADKVSGNRYDERGMAVIYG
ncbi:aldo/keto reductase [Kordiimonas sp. A6E486]|nr:aldo/keto reductase [Kordiimonas marina]MCJ9429694.1 aldo/keto reductase [Kordiimonas marina]